MKLEFIKVCVLSYLWNDWADTLKGNWVDTHAYPRRGRYIPPVGWSPRAIM